MTEKNAEKKYIERFKNDYAFRTFFFSAVSLITGAAYAAYNLFLGLAYSSAWNTGIAAYYLSLLCIRFFILSAEIKYVKKGYDEPQKEKARKRLFRVQSALLFATDISLIAPITLMTLQKKEVILLLLFLFVWRRGWSLSKLSRLCGKHRLHSVLRSGR